MSSFDEKYSYISAWVQDGQIEVGYGEYDDVFLRAIDSGGVIWESKGGYESMDKAFTDLEAGIKGWCQENGIEFEGLSNDSST